MCERDKQGRVIQRCAKHEYGDKVAVHLDDTLIPVDQADEFYEILERGFAYGLSPENTAKALKIHLFVVEYSLHPTYVEQLLDMRREGRSVQMEDIKPLLTENQERLKAFSRSLFNELHKTTFEIDTLHVDQDTLLEVTLSLIKKAWRMGLDPIKSAQAIAEQTRATVYEVPGSEQVH